METQMNSKLQLKGRNPQIQSLESHKSEKNRLLLQKLNILRNDMNQLSSQHCLHHYLIVHLPLNRKFFQNLFQM